MSGVNATIPGAKGTSTLVRATFAAGMLLQHEDMERLQAYPAELSRLLMRSLFGCGVVCGLVVRVKPKCGKVCVSVGAGLGLDCAGDPIHVPTDQSFALDEECNGNLPAELWVILCGTVKQCAQRPSMCASDDDEPPIRTRERDGFEIHVESKQPTCACGCLDDMRKYQPPEDESKCWCVHPKHPCYAAHYCGECGCHCDECSDCKGKCIVLARLTKEDDPSKPEGIWTADHNVRRFIRPVLMRDPMGPGRQAECEEKGDEDTASEGKVELAAPKPEAKSVKSKTAKSAHGARTPDA